MKSEIKVPPVGESVSTGTLANWLKKEGDRVSQGEDLFELETDKATVAVPAPATGVLAILVAPGAEVKIGQVVGSLDDAAVAALSVVAAAPVPPPQATDAQPKPAVPATRGSRQRRVPMSAVRRRIAAHLVEAKQAAAHLTTFNDVNMERIIEMRTLYRESFEKEHGVPLGFVSFFVKACCTALKAFPEVNAFIDGSDIVYNDRYDIGVAVSTDAGLLVPVIRDADRLSLVGIEKAIADLAARARSRKILPDELAGGTFSITNGGVFGSLLSTPIPNHPQSAILGMHAIQKRPVAVGEQVAIKPMMYAALSYDHRLIDGREAVGFLVRVKNLVEDPRLLLME